MKRPTRHLTPSPPLAILLAVSAAFLGSCATTDEPRAIYVIEDSGDLAYGKGDYHDAVAEYAEVVDRRPGKLSARIELGKALLKTGDAELAREHLNAAYAINPKNDLVIELLATSMLETGDTRSLTAFLNEQANDNNDPNSWMRLGRFLSAASDDDEAKNALLEAARLDHGTSVRPQLELARFYRAVGDDENAVRRYRMAMFIEPQNGEADDALREMGYIPGPTFALEPDER